MKTYIFNVEIKEQRVSKFILTEIKISAKTSIEAYSRLKQILKSVKSKGLSFETIEDLQQPKL